MKKRLIARILATVAFLLPFLLHSVGYIHIDPIERLESFAYDLRLRLTLPATVDDRIVIVDIDEQSLAAEGHWPWPRAKLGALVDQLFDQYNAEIVAFDVGFPEPDNSSGLAILERLGANELAKVEGYAELIELMRDDLDWDKAFAESLAQRKTILGYIFRQDIAADSVGLLPSPAISAADNVTNIDYFSPARFTGNIAKLQIEAGGGGFIDNPALDSDGVFRRVPVLQEFNGALYESLALSVVRSHLRSPPVSFVFDDSVYKGDDDSIRLEHLKVGPLEIPLGDNATVLVPYRGTQGSFPYVSATSVLQGTLGAYPLKNAIVLVGSSAPALKDLRATPVGRAFNGVEIHANVISGMLDGRIKYHPRYLDGVEFILLSLLAVIVTFIMVRFSIFAATMAVASLMLTTFLLNLWLFADDLLFGVIEGANFVLPLASLLTLVSLLFVVQLMLSFVFETRQRHSLSTLFGQYVPPELVSEMSINPRDFTMETESREMTVLISDVREFTSIAESLPPSQLSKLMNEFLTPMTRVIHRHRGTIDKYMGDAIMAFWGAPVAEPDHARSALLAAIEMQGALAELKPEFERRGWPNLRIGIGLNSGEMRVGNMGSEFRMAYTVLGDEVNLSSRVEGLTKVYGVDIAVGENTARSVPEFAYLELDYVRVKGRDRPVAIFEPLGLEKDLTSDLREMLRHHRMALDAYRGRRWDTAEREFFSLSQRFHGRKVFSIYLDRIAFFRQEPPTDDWDGVFIHKTK